MQVGIKLVGDYFRNSVCTRNSSSDVDVDDTNIVDNSNNDDVGVGSIKNFFPNLLFRSRFVSKI